MAATLCQIPTFHLSSLPCRHTTQHLRYHNPLTVQTSVSASMKKIRWSKHARRRNSDLCNDIREFLSVNGLPHDHIPTTNELTDLGRKDLANIVRRRGYKFIRELLGCSNMPVDGQDWKFNSLVENVDGGLNSVINGGEFSSHNFAEKSSINLSLQEKASRFLQNGKLDGIENSDFEFLNKSTYNEEKKSGLSGFSGTGISNGNMLSSLQQVDHAIDVISVQMDASPQFENKGVHVKTQVVDNQAEISRLKFMLSQKEMELMLLKQKIEVEKHALSALQIKAQTEMSKAHTLISEKNAELSSAEESLSGLKEVEILYRGKGESVEVAGSFNGWNHRIKMDPQTQASSIIVSSSLRISHFWRTILWLYPGIYEIKFVVDGHWRTDPERELVNRGTIANNVLRVET
ncbi:unnamed protein product [Cuscuta europaea]|uniref:AMP-activated protein kinase glycogen-binding domain-containing protein n=1 Tax=Cuscuta europaea TaxID=41803 RepID=A0A9P1EN84_CUSEU|nr:unnamed protein product [Cuscuta europaea]